MCTSLVTHHQVADDHDQHEDQDAERLARHLHAVPHGLDPLAAEHAEDDEEGVEEVVHVPARQLAALGDLADAVLVALPEQLRAAWCTQGGREGRRTLGRQGLTLPGYGP